jgi:hypothetical protein
MSVPASNREGRKKGLKMDNLFRIAEIESFNTPSRRRSPLWNQPSFSDTDDSQRQHFHIQGLPNEQGIPELQYIAVSVTLITVAK